MIDLWYNKPQILFNKWDQFFPTNNLSKEEKINAIVRFAIYYAVIIVLLNQDLKWLSVSVVLILISYFLGHYNKIEQENFESTCTEPTKDNPFMNFTLGDYSKDVNRPPACDYKKVKDKIKKEFEKDIVPDPADLWGQNISQRQFFTMPWTRVINDQSSFAQWTFGKSGECKNLGINCDKNRDNRYNSARYYIQY
jgi:hypothetical protein